MDCFPTSIAYETGYFPKICTEVHIFFHFFLKDRNEGSNYRGISCDQVTDVGRV